MSLEALRWVQEGGPHQGCLPLDIPPHLHLGTSSARLVLVNLAWHANDAGEARPSRDTVAAETGVARRDVEKALTAFVDLGLVELVAKAGGPGRPNRWKLLVPESAGIPRHVDAPGNPGTSRAESAGESAGERAGESAGERAGESRRELNGTEQNNDDGRRSRDAIEEDAMGAVEADRHVADEILQRVTKTGPAIEAEALAAATTLRSRGWTPSTIGAALDEVLHRELSVSTPKFFVGQLKWRGKIPMRAASEPAGARIPPPVALDNDAALDAAEERARRQLGDLRDLQAELERIAQVRHELHAPRAS